MIDFTIRELECFLAVAEELSFTRAAERLRLSQPPLTRHIQTLESKLGVSLFTRSPRAVSLTAAGRTLLMETKGSLTQLQHACDSAKRAARGEIARLSIGFVSAVLNPVLLTIFQNYRAHHRDVQLTLHDSPPLEQLRAIAEGRLDGGFVGTTPADKASGLDFVLWSKDPLLVFTSREHRLAQARKVHLSDLSEESFVAVSADSAPCFAAQIRNICGNVGYRPKVVQEAIRGQAVAAMVATGVGIAILPASLALNVGKSLAAVPIADKSAFVNYAFAHRKGKVDYALRAFIAELRRFAKKEKMKM